MSYTVKFWDGSKFDGITCSDIESAVELAWKIFAQIWNGEIPFGGRNSEPRIINEDNQHVYGIFVDEDDPGDVFGKFFDAEVFYEYYGEYPETGWIG